MHITFRTIVTSSGTDPKLSLPIHSYVWALSTFGILAFLEFNKIGLYLVLPSQQRSLYFCSCRMPRSRNHML
jgi:hypothetical protein